MCFNIFFLLFCFLFFLGLLIILFAVDYLGRKKSMAICFFMFSLCILPLYACIGRWDCSVIQQQQTYTLRLVASLRLILVVVVCLLLQGCSDDIHLHCKSLHLWRISSCFCLHTRGMNQFCFKNICRQTVVQHMYLFLWFRFFLQKSEPWVWGLAVLLQELVLWLHHLWLRYAALLYSWSQIFIYGA